MAAYFSEGQPGVTLSIILFIYSFYIVWLSFINHLTRCYIHYIHCNLILFNDSNTTPRIELRFKDEEWIKSRYHGLSLVCPFSLFSSSTESEVESNLSSCFLMSFWEENLLEASFTESSAHSELDCCLRQIFDQLWANFVYDVERSIFFFMRMCSCPNAFCWKDCFSTSELSCHPSWKSLEHKCVGLFLD